MAGKDKNQGVFTPKNVFKRHPKESELDDFESKSFRGRQMDLARLRFLEKYVNLKALPAVLAMIPVALGIIGLSVSPALKEYPPILFWIGVLMIASISVVLWGSRSHKKKEALFNCWTKAFEDSHALAIKRKKEDAEPAQPSEDRPSIESRVPKGDAPAIQSAAPAEAKGDTQVGTSM